MRLDSQSTEAAYHENIEAAFYETPEAWSPERYQRPEELARFEVTAAMIPAGTKSLVDIGCGNGAFLSCVESKRSIQLLGIDRSRTAIQLKLCQAPVQEGRAESLALPDQSYEVACALEVIEHFPYPIYQQALGELERVAGKYILISVPYREKRVKAHCPHCGCGFDPNFHMRVYDEEKLQNLFRKFNLVELRIVSTRTSLFAPQLYKIRQAILRGRRFPTGVICPLCGYRAPELYNSTKPALFSGVKGELRLRLKALWPKYRRKNWAVALYERNES